MAITIDGATKLITLDSASVSAAEIWSRWVDWHPANTQWPLAFSLVGGIALGEGLFIPPYFFLLNGWRVRPMNSDHNLTITGNLFVDGGGVPVVATADVHQVNVNYTVPVQAQGISTSGPAAPTAEQNAAAVWGLALEGLTAEQMMRVMLAALAGKRQGLGTATEQYMAQDGTTPRITLSGFDANGNGTPTLDGG